MLIKMWKTGLHLKLSGETQSTFESRAKKQAKSLLIPDKPTAYDVGV